MSDRFAQIVVPDLAYPYLVAQRGAIDDMKDDAQIWLTRYASMLASEFLCFEPYLPKECEAILDIGGGMGGINIVLNQHFGGEVEVTLLDGVADLPQMTRHHETFSNFEIAKLFLQTNGVKTVRSIDASAIEPRAPRFYDLVISLKSWCFHIPPERYLDLVKGCTVKGSKVIVDVRRERGDWELLLERSFRTMRLIYGGPKFNTFAFLV